MKSKAKKTPAKKAGASAKAKSGSKARASKQAKSKTATGKKRRAGSTATKRTGKVSKARAGKKSASRKPVAISAKGSKANTKKRSVQKAVETPVIVHGTDHHFIPTHETGTEMPQMNTRLDEQMRHTREQVVMNQENQKIKAGMASRSNKRRVFRIPGK